ncbi:hypothetical protein GIB67_012379 [Kingdonia uniflora]|uniref:S-adenosyl-L-methionine-dependent methyltransferase n=1 Tax=Kingdonia uniflora TaxID=39325 RepID=A0A7J7MPY0_9MAGN|nr:hypothetical protein GIB67_012379 [Kingdonia uniflora]
MACWSAENATKAYLRTLKMGKRDKEPHVSEFISALAAGNSAQLMVEICGSTAGSTTLALVAAAQQTGGHVVCILRGLDELHASQDVLGHDVDCVEFVIGDAKTLLLNYYKGADFVLIDCNIDDHEGIFRTVEESSKASGAVVVGYNAFCKRSTWRSGFKTQLLPIGGGLLVTRIPAAKKVGVSAAQRSRWIVRIDQCTGEEHVFRIRSPQTKRIEA